MKIVTFIVAIICCFINSSFATNYSQNCGKTYDLDDYNATLTSLGSDGCVTYNSGANSIYVKPNCSGGAGYGSTSLNCKSGCENSSYTVRITCLYNGSYYIYNGLTSGDICTCPKPCNYAIANSNSASGSLNSSSSRTVTCNSGYFINGVSTGNFTIACNDGTLTYDGSSTAKSCTTAVFCTLTSANYPNTDILSNTIVNNGASKNVKCNSGYYTDANGLTSFNVSCSNGVENGKKTCAKYCSIADINMGSYYISSFLIGSESVTTGFALNNTSVTANCSTGYGIYDAGNGTYSDTQSILCNSSGVWATPKTCVPKACYLNGTLYPNSSISSQSSIKVDNTTTKTVTCNAGYMPSGSASNNSFSITCNSGVLSGGVQCLKVCNVDPSKYSANNVDSTNVNNTKGNVFSGSTARLYCKSGFENLVSGLSYSYFDATCGADGNLSNLKTCTPKPCLFSGSLFPNTSIAQIAQNTINSGSSMNITCNSGYYANVEGSTSMNVKCTNSVLETTGGCKKRCAVSSIADSNLVKLTSNSLPVTGNYVSSGATINVACYRGLTRQKVGCNPNLVVKIPDCVNNDDPDACYMYQDCSEASEVFLDSYVTQCLDDGTFSSYRKCDKSVFTCNNDDGTAGSTYSLYSSSTPSATLSSGGSIIVNCNNTYYSSKVLSGFVSSSDTSFALTCKNGVFSGGYACVKKCLTSDLKTTSGISLQEQNTLADLTSGALVDSGTSVNVNCGMVNGINYGIINADGSSVQGYKTVCSSTGKFSVNNTCRQISCNNSEISITNDSTVFPLPPEFAVGTTPFGSSIKCPVGFITKTKTPPQCKSSGWSGSKNLACSPLALAAVPKTNSGVSINCKIPQSFFPNILTSASSQALSNGSSTTISCADGFYVNNSYDGTRSFPITCNNGYLKICDSTGTTCYQPNSSASSYCTRKCNRSDLGAVSSVSVYGASTTRTVFNPGEALNVMCLSGTGDANTTKDSGTGLQYYQTTCLDDGTFSTVYPCNASYIQCKNSDLIPFLDSTSVNASSVSSSSTTVSGGTVIPTCNGGYNTSDVAVCVNGVWKADAKNNISSGSVSSVLSTTNKIYCKKDCDPSTIAVGNETNVVTDKTPYKYNQVYTVSAQSLCGKAGVPELNFTVCLNGAWSNTLSCIPGCKSTDINTALNDAGYFNNTNDVVTFAKTKEVDGRFPNGHKINLQMIIKLYYGGGTSNCAANSYPNGNGLIVLRCDGGVWSAGTVWNQSRILSDYSGNPSGVDQSIFYKAGYNSETSTVIKNPDFTSSNCSLYPTYSY